MLNNNGRLTMEELDALNWYQEHNRQLKESNLDKNDVTSFIKLEKKKWKYGENTCIRCDGFLNIGHTRYCCECLDIINDYTDDGIVYGG